MEPYFFGKPGHSLFGVFHAPGVPARDLGVVLCPPAGQESIRAHRAFLQLARRLASAGVAVLRFDYFGCGDSEGDFEDARLADWLGDVATAVEELREGADVERVCLVGLRLGASLAALAAAESGDVDSLVLWEPVVEGGRYLAELAEQHQAWLRGSFARPREGDPVDERMGFALTRGLAEDLAGLDLARVGPLPLERVLAVEGEGRSPAPALAALAGAAELEHRALAMPPVWLKVKGGEDFSAGVVPNAVLDAVVGWVVEGAR